MVALGSVLNGWAISAIARGDWGSYSVGHCDLSNVQLTLPDAQLAVLGKPNSSHPTAVGVAFGVQNYTCSTNNNFTSVFFLAKGLTVLTCAVLCIFSSTGAVAQLYDISCLSQSSPDLFTTIQEPLYDAWVNLTSEITVQEITAIIPALLSPDVILADHYFVPNPSGSGLSPVWDFRATQRFHGNQNAFILAAGVGSVAAPVDPAHNINWLRVRKVSGDIADEVYRTDTIGGQPPTSVSFSSRIRFREYGSANGSPPRSALTARARISASNTFLSIGSLEDQSRKLHRACMELRSYVGASEPVVFLRSIISCCCLLLAL